MLEQRTSCCSENQTIATNTVHVACALGTLASFGSLHIYKTCPGKVLLCNDRCAEHHVLPRKARVNQSQTYRQNRFAKTPMKCPASKVSSCIPSANDEPASHVRRLLPRTVVNTTPLPADMPNVLRKPYWLSACK